MNPDVSDYYTSKSRETIQHFQNIERPPYAFQMDFGNRLRDARNDADLTGEKLGERLGVSKQTIAHWEANRYEPKLVYLAKLSDVLDVSVDWLVTGKSIESLSPAAVKQGRFYDALSLDGRRKWEAAKMLIRDASPRVADERRTATAATPAPDMGGNPISSVSNSETPHALMNHPDTLDIKNKHLTLSYPKPGKKKRGAASDQRSTDTGSKSPKRGEHAPSSTPPSRAGKA